MDVYCTETICITESCACNPLYSYVNVWVMRYLLLLADYSYSQDHICGHGHDRML